ncbi:hypothetical protein GWK41_07035 [Persephonella atlantica]|uniref:Lipoprotein n=1 Tax=Persephonella atlantica TaxID=2699429 RepID=A0ABS1GJ03_9AQUI|nr:hypothetical protein [Persephonella atlantica]MBK3332820.1 hypothetical protein [Persephonella atlantica]
MKRILSVILTLIVVSCGGKTDKTEQVKLINEVFSPSDVSWFLKKGSNTIIGQAFIRTKSGDVITCAGYEVELIPYSKYAEKRMEYIYGNSTEGFVPIKKFPYNIRFFPEYREYENFKKKSVCDAAGVFKFKNLPDGKYYIVSLVYWETYQPEGGFLMKKVSVKNGEIREVILSKYLNEHF